MPKITETQLKAFILKHIDIGEKGYLCPICRDFISGTQKDIRDHIALYDTRKIKEIITQKTVGQAMKLSYYKL